MECKRWLTNMVLLECRLLPRNWKTQSTEIQFTSLTRLSHFPSPTFSLCSLLKAISNIRKHRINFSCSACYDLWYHNQIFVVKLNENSCCSSKPMLASVLVKCSCVGPLNRCQRGDLLRMRCLWGCCVTKSSSQVTSTAQLAAGSYDITSANENKLQGRSVMSVWARVSGSFKSRLWNFSVQ